MSEHLVVIHSVSPPSKSDLWRAECCCGWKGEVVFEHVAEREAAVHEAVAEEREACAALMERMAPNGSKLVGLAAAIRARGKS